MIKTTNTPTKKQVLVYLAADQHKQLKLIAVELEISVSALLEETTEKIIQEYTKQEK